MGLNNTPPIPMRTFQRWNRRRGQTPLTMRLSTVLLVAWLMPASVQGQAGKPVPVGDYHAHLNSSNAARLLSWPTPPVVALPESLDKVIREWERALKIGDPDLMTSLFTADGLWAQSSGWAQGSEAILALSVDANIEELSVRAFGYSIADTVATVTGSLSTGVKGPGRDVANVAFTLRRAAGGQWLIASFVRENRPASSDPAELTASQLIQQLDSAGIKRAVVLSEAYWFGSSLMPGAERGLPLADEYARVKAENDWVANEVAKYPTRLVGFCSVNPLKSYALEEVARCGSEHRLHGLKLHLANSDVNLRNPEQVAQLARVFRAANQARLPVVVHMRPRRQPYGREDVEIMLRDVLSQAPDVPIQVAHLAGWGGYDDATDEAAGAFADAIARKDPATRNLYFDTATIVFPQTANDVRERIARRIRQLGVNRVVFGGDLASAAEPSRERGILQFLYLIPLSEAELRAIASNVVPYLGQP